MATLPALRADTFSINPNTADGQVADTNFDSSGTVTVQDQTDYECRIGELYSPGGACYVVPFLLPTLAAGQVFTEASLQFQLYNVTGAPADADLYGLRTNASPQPVTGDYYQGTLDTSNTLIQPDFLTPTSPVRTDPTTGPFVTTSTLGSTALVSFLNSVDVNNSAAGKYVFLRVSYDADPIPNGNNAYNLLTEDAGGAEEKPLLSLTSGLAPAPEPSTFLLVGLTGAAFVAFRRRRS